ncbi:hypothetical protein [Ectopseudomonas composti]|jgi:hypothetical protein|uniref:hypothetical protein n=1 Tax=Ectopseudomonas composti TaxID=658457 RepID=UPI000AB5AA7B|nr:hypothetical protein [Pseudomonas composti]
MRVPITEDDPKVTLRRKQIVIGLCSAGRSLVEAIDTSGDPGELPQGAEGHARARAR